MKSSEISIQPRKLSGVFSVQAAEAVREVAQVTNLLYRRFPIGWSSELAWRPAHTSGLQAGSLRYSRLETCATALPFTLPRHLTLDTRHSPRRHPVRAFSLIEILVAVALMSFIVIGLLITFNQVSRVFRAGMTQVDILAGGRTIMDTIMRDLEQMTPSGTPNTLNFSAEGSLLFVPPLAQPLPPGNTVYRTNAIQKLFFLTRYNQDWTGTGYEVLDNYGAGCVGSLYRFTTNGRANVSSMSLSFRAATSSNLNLVADGIVSFRVTAFATNGFPVMPNLNFPTPTNGVFQNAQTGNSTLIANTSANWDAGVPGLVDSYFVSNAVPGYVEVELGMLEPQILERFRSIGNPAAQRAYLEQHVAQVHVFRQRIAVRNVDFSAYVYP